MKETRTLMGLILMAFVVSSGWAQTPAESAASNHVARLGRFDYPLAAIRLQAPEDLSSAVLGRRPFYTVAEALGQEEQEGTTRSVKRAALFSAIIPGAGQLYNRSYLKSLAFLAIEAGSWLAYGRYTNLGNQKTDEFKRFADLHWDEGKYWQSLSDESGIPVQVRDKLREYEHASFSHFLPETKNQTYYENIGKYNQFNAGWDDGSHQARKEDSANREHYTFMRRDANDQFKRATLGVTVALFNHVISALEAAYSTYRFNQSQTRVSLGSQMQPYDTELVPALSLNLEW